MVFDDGLGVCERMGGGLAVLWHFLQETFVFCFFIFCLDFTFPRGSWALVVWVVWFFVRGLFFGCFVHGLSLWKVKESTPNTPPPLDAVVVVVVVRFFCNCTIARGYIKGMEGGVGSFLRSLLFSRARLETRLPFFLAAAAASS